MGFLDSIFGKDDEEEVEGIKGPSTILRENGIDPSGLKFSFGSDGTVTVTGEVQDEARRAQISELIEGIDQVSAVDNQLVINVPSADAIPDAVADAIPDSVADALADAGSVTVGGGSQPSAADSGTMEDSATTADSNAGTADTGGSQTYTVQSGDTLWKIAEEAYGNGADYMKIFEANRDQLDNPDLIKVGQVLNIPS